jgi:hypothetical protein
MFASALVVEIRGGWNVSSRACKTQARPIAYCRSGSNMRSRHVHGDAEMKVVLAIPQAQAMSNDFFDDLQKREPRFQKPYSNRLIRKLAESIHSH